MGGSVDGSVCVSVLMIVFVVVLIVSFGLWVDSLCFGRLSVRMWNLCLMSNGIIWC